MDYEFEMGKFAVTVSQYAALLNAVAADDTYGLYLPAMANYGIGHSGSAGDYSYTVDPARSNRPARYISWGNAVRFTNWLANGQPVGTQNLGTTESGSYFLNGATSHEALNDVVRLPDATYVVPTQDEWVKAGYYNSLTGSYYRFATSSDTMPGNVLPDTGNNANHSALESMDVGSYVNSASPYGTYDQAGGVAEWLEDYGAFLSVRKASNNYYRTPRAVSF